MTNTVNRQEGRALSAALALAAAGALWGATFWLAKIALAELGFWHVVFWRFAIGALALLPFMRISGFSRAELLLLFLVGALTVPGTFLLQFAGLARTTATNAALIVGAVPVLTAIAGWLFLGERLSRAGWLAVALSFAGVVLVIGPGGSGGPHWQGDAMVLASLLLVVASWAVLSSTLLKRHAALPVTAAMLVLGTVVLIPVVLAVAGTPPVRLSFGVWAALLALAIPCTAATNLLWNWGLARLPASRAGVFINIEPLVGAILGVALLGEPLGAGLLAGGALILAGANLMIARGHPSAQ